jgi:hypothetical protein
LSGSNCHCKLRRVNLAPQRGCSTVARFLFFDPFRISRFRVRVFISFSKICNLFKKLENYG